jgi:hypothetical protein
VSGFTSRFAALLIAFAACLPNLALAQSADVLIEQGIALRNEGHDAEALPLFERAFAQDPSARPEAQLGLVQLGLGQFVAAELHLRQALASNDAWVETNRAPLTEAHAAAAEHVGTVEILGAVEGAQVSVNGTVEGAMPLDEPVRALIGRCVIDVTAAGHRAYSTEVTIRAGELSRVTVALVPSLVVEDAPMGNHDVTNEGWFWPVVLGGSALVIGGVILGVVLGTQSDPLEPDNLGGVFMALEGSF